MKRKFLFLFLLFHLMFIISQLSAEEQYLWFVEKLTDGDQKRHVGDIEIEQVGSDYFVHVVYGEQNEHLYEGETTPTPGWDLLYMVRNNSPINPTPTPWGPSEPNGWSVRTLLNHTCGTPNPNNAARGIQVDMDIDYNKSIHIVWASYPLLEISSGPRRLESNSEILYVSDPPYSFQPQENWVLLDFPPLNISGKGRHICAPAISIEDYLSGENVTSIIHVAYDAHKEWTPDNHNIFHIRAEPGPPFLAYTPSPTPTYYWYGIVDIVDDELFNQTATPIPPTPISLRDETNPSLDFGPISPGRNNGHVAYTLGSRRGDELGIFYKRYDAQSQSWQPQEWVDPEGQGSPHLKVDSNDCPHLIYGKSILYDTPTPPPPQTPTATPRPNHYYLLYTNRCANDAWGTPTPFLYYSYSDPDLKSIFKAHAMTIDSNDEIHIVVSESIPPEQIDRIVYLRYDIDSNFWIGPEDVISNDDGFVYRAVAISIDGNNQPHIIFKRERDISHLTPPPTPTPTPVFYDLYYARPFP